MEVRDRRRTSCTNPLIGIRLLPPEPAGACENDSHPPAGGDGVGRLVGDIGEGSWVLREVKSVAKPLWAIAEVGQRGGGDNSGWAHRDSRPQARNTFGMSSGCQVSLRDFTACSEKCERETTSD